MLLLGEWGRGGLHRTSALPSGEAHGEQPSGQGWEQQPPRLQPFAGPVTVAFKLFTTGGLNISPHLREDLGIHIPVVG